MGAAYWLKGAHYDILTDHKPLISLYNEQRLDLIKNVRIRNARMSLIDFNYTVHFIPGKLNVVSDCLSRKPLWEEDSKMSRLSLHK
jgi:hypothetical protein